MHSSLIPIGKDEELNLRSFKDRNGRHRIYFNVWETDKLRGHRNSQKGFSLDAEMIEVLQIELEMLLEDINK